MEELGADVILSPISPGILGDEAAIRALLEQAPYIHPGITECCIRDEALRLTLADGAPRATIMSSAASLCERVARSFRKVAMTVMFEHDGHHDGEDPLPTLLSSGQVHFTSPGTAAYAGSFLALLEALDAVFMAEALRMGAEPRVVPPTVSWSTLARSGYLHAFPHNAVFCSPAAVDPEALDAVRHATRTGTRLATRWLAPIERVLAPTVCYPCLEAMQGQTLPTTGTLVTARARCHRHEHLGTSGLERLGVFTMREVIAIGTSDYALGLRAQLIEHAERLCQQWGLTARVVTATDPFFEPAADSKRLFQSVMATKYELQLLIPHVERWLAVASFNDHDKVLTRSVQIELKDGSAAASACVGYGYERLAYALLAQLGLDPAAWPDSIRGSR